MSHDDNHTLESKIWQEIDIKSLSPSHDHWHIDRVLEFARQLQMLHGGDLDVVIAAVILHDLGRQDPALHGQDSISRSVEHAESILKRVNFSSEKTNAVLTAIGEHDQPRVTPSTIEGRILKEADFLAGFGVWGMLRIAMWAGETRDGFDQVRDRIKNRMPKRFSSLQFPESRRQAWVDMLLAGVFLSRLDQPSRISECQYTGKYVVLEGISGTGKDTQADHLKEMLEEHGHKVLRINEPTEVYKDLRSSLAPHELQIQSTGIADPVMNMFLLMADRYKIVTEQVIPALAEGTIVVSVRSFISTLVYQENLIYNPAFQAFAHNFVPPPDLVILYDVDPDIAFSRIQNRKRRLGFHEHPESLKKYRQKYVEVCESLPLLSYRLIYTGSSIETVWSETKKVAEECLPELFQTGSK